MWPVFMKLAQNDPEQWQIWDKGTFSFDKVKKPFNYIKSDLDDSDLNTPSNDRVEQSKYKLLDPVY